jgi:hypothetical protein
MQQWDCSLHGTVRNDNTVFSWPSCGGGCVQNDECIECFTKCGTWGKGGSWDACDCPATCYPEGIIADQTIKILREKAENPGAGPWFHAVGLKRPHLSYRAPSKFFDLYNIEDISLPLHPKPSLSAPPIAYSHSCQVSSNVTVEEMSKYGIALFDPRQDPNGAKECVDMVLNTTSGEAVNVEINENPTSVRLLKRAYYAVISFTDSQLGRILDAVEEFGLANNTIITLIGDHGYQWTKGRVV